MCGELVFLFKLTFYFVLISVRGAARARASTPPRLCQLPASLMPGKECYHCGRRFIKPATQCGLCFEDGASVTAITPSDIIKFGVRDEDRHAPRQPASDSIHRACKEILKQVAIEAARSNHARVEPPSQ